MTLPEYAAQLDRLAEEVRERYRVAAYLGHARTTHERDIAMIDFGAALTRLVDFAKKEQG